MQFTLLFTAITVAIGTKVSANPVPAIEAPDHLMAVDQLKHWLATTDATITYVGEPINALTPRESLVTTVVYCNTRTGNICGGACTTYTGVEVCLPAPSTACISATRNVLYCTTSDCSGAGTCQNFSACTQTLNNGFCATPGTRSIRVL